MLSTSPGATDAGGFPCVTAKFSSSERVPVAGMGTSFDVRFPGLGVSDIENVLVVPGPVIVLLLGNWTEFHPRCFGAVQWKSICVIVRASLPVFFISSCN